MAYDYRKWAAAHGAERRRHPWTPWGIGIGIAASLTVAVVAVLRPGVSPLAGAGAFWSPVIISIMSPFGRETWFTGRGRAVFDEFERDAMRHASQRAYSILLLLVLSLLLWCWIASLAGWPIPAAPDSWLALLFATVGIGATLPILFAEIMVPMPPVDDPEED